jgi:hypothetical protein
MNFFHGGVPGLRKGDLLKGGHTRDNLHPGCKFCEERAAAAPGQGGAIDPASSHPEHVYFTADKEYARYHASLYGRGDLYLVDPGADFERSTEDLVLSFHAPSVTIIGVIERRVLLRWSERRTLYVKMGRLEGLTKRQALEEFDRQFGEAERMMRR